MAERRVTFAVNGMDPVSVFVDEGDTIEVSVDDQRFIGLDLDGATLTIGTWEEDYEWVELAEATAASCTPEVDRG